ncbi:MAG: glycosyltransferase [Bacteroidetes bacterium]|nr:glycosyltransferase [Bacteroidota bacterium]
MKNKIFAVVVTYNRCSKLKLVIEGLLAQSRPLDSIIVVNNASTDDTKFYLESLGSCKLLETVHLDENIGGAGGFYTAIKRAYEKGADWVWTFDDDAVPIEDALSTLLNAPVIKKNKDFDQIGFLASRVDWIDGNRHAMNISVNEWAWPFYYDKYDKCFMIHTSSFVGMLISREAIKKVGYPIKEFFIWADDTEYSTRVSAQFPCFLVFNSVIIHHTETNVGANITDVEKHTLWKYKYGFRNVLAIEFRESNSGRIVAPLRYIKTMLSLIRHKPSLSIITGMGTAGLKGFFFSIKNKIEKPKM